jgi:hypothetical protein
MYQKFEDEWVWKLPRIKDGLNEDGINIQVCFEVPMKYQWWFLELIIMKRKKKQGHVP